MPAANDDFLRYYLEELSYLRHMGQRFSRDYPKVAGRLDLQPDDCPDPHVERLIESFAFLTARIQSDLDNDFPEIAAELLNVLYPHYLNPIPSMGIARFDFDPERGKLSTGYDIPRHTPLFATGEQGAVCRWRTAYPVELWPVEITEAELETPETYEFIRRDANVGAVLRIRLESRADPFDVLNIDHLRFYFHGDASLYELLFHDVTNVAVLSAGAKSPRNLGPNAVQPIGFADDEELLPYPRHAHPGYRLLQEYFTFPQKFQFADVHGLGGNASGEAVDLLFYLDRAPKRKLLINKDSFALGCTPVVNLFRKTSEPVRVDHRHLEYRLIGDMRKEKTTEIHSILSVSGSSDAGNRLREYAPFYSLTHVMEQRKQAAFWHARRTTALNAELSGTDLMLSFRDAEFNPTDPPDEVVFAHLLCTNRLLAREIPAGAILQTDEALPVAHIVMLGKPTPRLIPPLGGETLWRLISHLSLNYLSLGSDDESLRALHEILNLYAFSDAPAVRQRIHGVRRMSHRKIVRRMGSGDWTGFTRGTEVKLTFDESQYIGSSAYLLASVLNHFFALYASTNSFTQLVIERTDREGDAWKRWPPMAGASAVL